VMVCSEDDNSVTYITFGLQIGLAALIWFAAHGRPHSLYKKLRERNAQFAVRSSTSLSEPASIEDLEVLKAGARRWHLHDQHYRDSLAESRFVTHVRSEGNFVQDSLSPSMVYPPGHPPERELLATKRKVLYAMLFTGDFALVFVDAICMALFAGGLGSLLWMCNGCGIKKDAASYSAMHHWIHTWSESFEVVYDMYTFFPAFLILGQTTYAVTRWREFLVNAHTVQGRLHDIGLMVGGAVIHPGDPTVRRKLFKLYRYLNLVHSITYQSVNPYIPQTLEEYIPLGLLCSNEVRVLEPLQFKARDVVITWVAAEIEDLVRTHHIRELAVTPQTVQSLRAICARHHDLFTRNNPNCWVAIMKLVTDYVVVLTVVGLPFILLGKNDGKSAGHCFQPWTIFGVFLIVSAYQACMRLVLVLDQPYDREDDSYNCDALLVSTERCLFSQLRALFDISTRDADTVTNLETQKCSSQANDPSTGKLVTV